MNMLEKRKYNQENEQVVFKAIPSPGYNAGGAKNTG
jgi:hypothetical protein